MPLPLAPLLIASSALAADPTPAPVVDDPNAFKLSLSIEADVYIDYIAVRSTQVTQHPCLSTPFLTSAAPFLFQAFIVVDAGDSVASITPTPDPMDESASLFLCTFRSQSDQNQRRL